jgi:predicted metal-dependent hydrolase
MLDWAPDFTIKRSRRAKTISLRITQRNGLVLTIPQHLHESVGLAFLQQKKSWIEKHLHTIKNKKDSIELPAKIDLLAINKSILIRYQSANLATISVIESPEQITLLGDINNHEACLACLKTWLIKQAKYYLPIELNTQSERLGLKYTDVTIRQQQTRWGSCSAKKRINLNYKLILLPRVLMEYILIHELCHTVHLNHSATFWRSVKKFCPDFEKYHAELRQVIQYMPAWL